jgi:hypothetical protein
MHLRTLMPIALIVILVGVLAAPLHAQQPDLRQAGLLVVHGDGSVVSGCVAFSEESISGAELLRRSGMEVTLDAYGGLGYGVCAIGDEGCPAGQDCFCECRATPCAYWVYSHRHADGSWAISGVGASAWQVRDGYVDGWVWGDGSTAPPAVDFEQVCPPGAAAPAAPALVSDGLPSAAASATLPTITSAPLLSPAVPTATPVAVTEARGRDSSSLGYVVFGVVVVGLAGWLIVAGARGSRA